MNLLDELACAAGSFDIGERGQLDFARWHRVPLSSAFFVTRAKQNFRCQRRSSRPVDKPTALRFEQTVILTGFYAPCDYPEPLRRIGFHDRQTGQALVFLTTNFTEPALTSAPLYRCRWRIELFFKWIKQPLRSKAFDGTADNAVRVQVWTALTVCLLVASLKKRRRLPASLDTVLQILSLTLFEEIPVLQALSQQPQPIPVPDTDSQPCLPGLFTGQW